MALYVTILKRSGETNNLVLHLPTTLSEGIKELFTGLNPVSYQLIAIQADGHELDFILNNFAGIRTSRGRVVSWLGDDAIFILNNLPSLLRRPPQ